MKPFLKDDREKSRSSKVRAKLALLRSRHISVGWVIVMFSKIWATRYQGSEGVGEVVLGRESKGGKVVVGVKLERRGMVALFLLGCLRGMTG